MTEIPATWLVGRVFTPGEVAKLFNVSVHTVAVWSKSGVIGFFRTRNGHRRYPEVEVLRMMKGEPVSDLVRQLCAEDRERWHKKWLEEGWHQNPVTRAMYDARHGEQPAADEAEGQQGNAA